MSEELIDSYVNRQAVADDTKFLTDQLKAVLELFEKVNATKISLGGAKSMSDVVTGAKEATKAVDELSAGKKKLLEIDLQTAQNAKQIVVAQVQQASGVKVLNDSYDKLIKQLIANEERLRDIGNEMGELKKAFEEGRIRLENYKAKMEELKKEQISLKSTNQDATRAVRNFNKEAQGSEGSLKQMRAELNLATQAFDGLSRAEKQTDVGQQLKKQIIDITEAIKQEEEETKRFFRNVGNYPASAKIIVDALEKAKEKFNQLSQAVDTTPAALEDARRHFESLRSVVDDRQFVKYAASAGDAQKEVKAFTRVLVDLEQRGEGNSQAAIDLRKHLAELTDQVADAKDAIKALSSDTHSFDQFAGAVNFAVDTVQTFVGAMALSADSEQDVQEATKTLLALQTVSNGIKGIATELTTRGTAANKLYAFAQRQVALAMDSTATSGTRLKAVLATIGFGAVIIGIGLLIANFDKVKRAITGVSKEQEALNDVMKEAGSEYSSAVKTVSQLKTNIDLAKQGFIEKEKVIKEYNDSIGKTTGQVKSLDEAEQQLIEKGDAYIEMTLKKAVANIALEKAAQKAFEAEEKKRKEAEEFLTTADKATRFGAGNVSAPGFVPNLQTQATKTAIDYNKTQSEKRKKAAIKESEDEQKVYTDIANEATKAAAEIAKKFNLNFFGDNKSVQQSVQAKKFRDGLLKDDADMYKRLSEVQEAYLTTRISAREKSFEIEKQILDGQRYAELTNLSSQLDIERKRASVGEISKDELVQKEKDTAFKRSEINKDYAEKQVLLERGLAHDLLSIRQTFIAYQRELDQQANDQFLQDDKDRIEKELQAEQERIKRRQNQDALNQDAEINSLNKLYEEKIISEKEYQQRKFEIERYYSLKSQTDTINDLQKLIDKQKLAGQNTIDLERQVADIRKSIDDELTNRLLDNREKLKQKEREVAEQVVSGVQSLIEGGYDRQKNALQDQIDKINEKKQAQIDEVNASLATEQEKAAKIANINATAQAQQEQIQKKQRDIDVKKAQFDKAIGILKVGIDTQGAVSSLAAKAAQAKAEAALLAANPVTAIYAPIATAAAIAIASQIPLALASGAIQAGLIAAQTIPRYKFGRDGGPAEWAITGDGGVPEVAASPDLKQHFITPATDTLTYLPQNWKVFPDVDAFQRAAMGMAMKPVIAMPSAGQGSGDGLLKAYKQHSDRIVQAIKDKPTVHIQGSHAGVMAVLEYGNTWTEYVDKSVNF